MPTMLKRSYTKKEDIPEAAAGLYKENGDKFELNPEFQIEGTVPTTKLEEFRTNNTKLRERLEAYGDKEFGGGEVEPDTVRELMGRSQELADANLVKRSDVQARVEQRVGEFKVEFEKKEKKYQGTIESMQSRLRKEIIERKALEAGIPFGLRKGAEKNLVLLVNSEWTIDDNGEPVAYEQDGKTVRMGPSGEAMRGTDALKAFVERLSKDDAKFLFEENRGTDADQRRSRGGEGSDAGEVNPFDPKTLNVTAQGAIIKKDFAKAQRMAARFGVALKPSALRETAGTR